MNVPEKNSIPYDLIAKFLNGDADTNERIDLEQWKGASPENAKTLDECTSLWEKTGQLSPFTDVDIDYEWNFFLSNINQKQKEKANITGTHFLRSFLRVAASLLIGIILGYSGWYIYRSASMTKVVAKSELLEVDLPDGSKISLNRNSRIKYPNKFKNNRILDLEGEAYFDVMPDDSHPFIIRSGKLRIEVVGTSFNVMARKSDQMIQVVVESGVVAVYDKSESFEKELIQAGEMFEMSRKSGIRSISPANDPNISSWKTGMIRFENVTLEYATEILQQLYQTPVLFGNPGLNECRIIASFENESLEYILETIAETLDLQVIRTRDGFVLNGSGCKN